MQRQGLPLRTFAIFLLAAVIGVAGGVLGSFFQRGLNWLQEWLTGGSGSDIFTGWRPCEALVPPTGSLRALPHTTE